MKKRDIHVVNRYFHPVSAGIETALMQILTHLDHEKYSITVHTTASTFNSHNTLSPEETIDGIRVKRYRSIKLAFIPSISYNQVDVLVLTNFTLIPHVFILLNVAILKLLGLKQFQLIFFPCGGFTPDWKTISPLARSMKRIIHSLFGRPILNYCADLVLAISKWEKDELVTNGISGDRIRILPLGVEDYAFGPIDQPSVTDAAKKIVKKNTPYIVQVSRIHPIKNIETVIKALALVKQPLSYVVIGGVEQDDYLQELKALAERENISERVVFTNKLSTQDKYFLIDNSLCMVHMSRNESFGLSVYEGMSRGKIGIVGDNSALKEAIVEGRNGYLLKTSDYKGLAEKLTYLLSSKSTTERLTIEKNNKKDMQKFTWQNVAHLLESLMSSE